METIGIIVLFAGFALLIRLAAGSFDGERVEAYVSEKGWELVDKSWSPFGPGWFGEKDSRIYQIVYRDEYGDLHRAHVKTSMFSGVYLTNDEVVERAQHDESPEPSEGPSASELESLRSENARLKERLRQLEPDQDRWPDL